MARRRNPNRLQVKGKALIRPTKTIQISSDIRITEKQHTALIQHIENRLLFGDELRKGQVDRFELIDKEIAGYIRLDDDDLKREKDNILGKGPKVTDVNLPLTLAQLDEAITVLLSMLAPDEAMYSAIAIKTKQKVAKGFATLMNKNADIFGHYRHMARGLFEMMKYNVGGFLVEWREIHGNKITSEPGGGTKIENTVVFAGNAVEVLDQYNFIYDIAVHPVDLPKQGEFFALVSVKTPFRLKKMEADGEVIGIDRFIGKTDMQPKYFKTRPEIYIDHSGRTGKAGRVNWLEVLSAGTSQDVRVGIELVDYYGWINPKDFGLSDTDEFQIWRFTRAANNHIIAAEHLNNAHGSLPCALGSPWDDGFGSQTKAYSEHLFPYQRFSSFQLNIHQRSARKKLYGVTIYNQRIIPSLADADMQSAKIPALPPGQDFDLRKAILQFTDGPDTQNTLADIDAMDDLMQKILPTDLLKQVASLERATQYQAAATVQGANRRSLKNAKVIDDQCFKHLRFMQMYNIFQFQEIVEILDDNGELTQINPGEFREAQLEFDISDGLKGIDRLSIIEGIKDVINMMLQSQVAGSKIDIVAIIDYWTSLLGEKTDFTQFKINDVLDSLDPEQRQIAVQLFEQFAAQQQQQGNGAGQAPAQLPGPGGV